MNTTNPFDRSGLVPLSDFETTEWKEHFEFLEAEQIEFRALESAFRSPEYKWPRDPLHTWSRAWEYPYVLHHLRAWREKTTSSERPCVVDVGSGVTFFPFTVAKLGCRVICTDIDPVCEKDINRAVKIVPHKPGLVDYRNNDGSRLSCDDNEADAVYCISVLEHVDSPEEMVAEMGRILKPSGLLILTVDMDLRGDLALSVKEYARLREALLARFDWWQPETTVHPINVLHSDIGPFGMQSPKGLRLFWFHIKQRARQLLRGRKPLPPIPFRLSVCGFVMIKR